MQLPPDFAQHSPEITLPPGHDRVAVHCCCAPCAGAVLETMKQQGIDAVVYFFNPNIHPETEYVRRRDELIEFCTLIGLPYAVGDYNVRDWFAAVKGHEDEPERSARCQLCFNLRLLGTALFAKEQGITLFTSTLATSRWKSRAQVDAAGQAAMAATGVTYWAQDWRKQGLADRRNQLVKELKFYNQTYCGCVYGRLNERKTKELHQRRPRTQVSAAKQGES